ncbi:MAG: LysR family transcriptional regulator, partial [Burkholderiales bacterium]
MDHLHSMRVFAAVTDAGSFARAAERLDLSNAMVTRYVAALETRLGTRLLNRSTRKLSLTETGAAYLERCLNVLTTVDEADAAARAQTTVPRGTLRVNAALGFGVRHLSPAIAAYQTRYTEVSVDVTFADRYVDIAEEGFDVVIRIGQLGPSSLVARQIAATEVILCAAPSYLARAGTPRSPADLARHNCLNYTYSSTGNEWWFEKGGARSVARVDGDLRANNGDALTLAAIAGRGVIYQPRFYLEDALRTGALVRLLPDYSSPWLGIHAVYLSR